jgi:hypothetical protein
MTNATKTLAIVFAATLVLALASTWRGGTSSSAAFQDQLLAVDTSAVQAIRIDRPQDRSLRLERADGEWSVAPADTSATYPASSQSVNQLFSTLPALSVSAVTTRQPDKHPRYGVDSTGTRITMLGAGDEPLGDLIVGRTEMRRPQSQGRQQNPMQRMRQMRRGTPITYVRSPNRPDVYSVEQSLRSVTGRTLTDWRDKQLWALSRSAIRQIDFTFPGDSSFTMQRAAPSDTAATGAPDTWLSAGDTLATAEVSSVLRTLSSPRADGFVNDTSPDDFGEAPYRVRVRTADGSRHTLRLRPTSGGNEYVAVADAFPYVVTLDKTEWDDSVLQGRTALLQNE